MGMVLSCEHISLLAMSLVGISWYAVYGWAQKKDSGGLKNAW